MKRTDASTSDVPDVSGGDATQPANITEVVVHYPRRAAVPILFGASMFIVQIPLVPRTSGNHTLRYAIGAIAIALLLGWAARFLGNPRHLTIGPHEVIQSSLLGIEQKPVRIDGFSDLAIDSDALFRRADDRKIANLGSFKARPADVTDLATVIERSLDVD